MVEIVPKKLYEMNTLKKPGSLAALAIYVEANNEQNYINVH
jgi:hypothetical protein